MLRLLWQHRWSQVLLQSEAFLDFVVRPEIGFFFFDSAPDYYFCHSSIFGVANSDSCVCCPPVIKFQIKSVDSPLGETFFLVKSS